MKRIVEIQALSMPLVLAGSLLLAGCSTGLLGGGSNKLGGPTDVQSVPVGNNLALPPDLSLPPPGEGNDNVQANTAPGTGDQSYDTAGLDPAPAKPVAKRDIYAENNISKLKPDGTEKSPTELQRELKAALLAKKRQQNPRYGTIFNIGSVFQE